MENAASNTPRSRGMGDNGGDNTGDNRGLGAPCKT